MGFVKYITHITLRTRCTGGNVNNKVLVYLQIVKKVAIIFLHNIQFRTRFNLRFKRVLFEVNDRTTVKKAIIQYCHIVGLLTGN